MKNVVSAAIITNARGEFLFQFRDARAPTSSNEWGLFGGHKEGDETPIQTLVRELKEEIDISFAEERFSFLETAAVDSAYGPAEISLYRLVLHPGEEKQIRLGEGGGYRFFGSKEEVIALPELPAWLKSILERLL